MDGAEWEGYGVRLRGVGASRSRLIFVFSSLLVRGVRRALSAVGLGRHGQLRRPRGDGRRGLAFVSFLCFRVCWNAR